MTSDAAELPEICKRPADKSDVIGLPCPACGHVNVVHYHTPECTVCALQYEVAVLRKARGAAV